MYNLKENKSLRDIVLVGFFILIIIALLLHQYVVNGRRKNSGNSIDICDEGDEDCARPGHDGLYINCLEDIDNPICVVPDFTGKTEKDVLEWLSKISNNIDISYQVYDSKKDSGTIIDQSNEKNITVKSLLDNNIPLIISFANSRNKTINCIDNPTDKNCIIPDFTGKAKNDVYDWLNNISNELNINFTEKKSKTKNGTIISQSIKTGTNVKDVIENNQSLDITFSNNEKVDCLKDENNEVCVIPNFTGYTQREIEEWLDTISNQVKLRYEENASDLKSNTIISQSVKPGSSIKQLIYNDIPLTVTFAKGNDNAKVDCLKNVNNSKCILPDFTGMTKSDVNKWLESISNNIPIFYENVTSTVQKGNIISQSISKGTTVKDILENNKQLIFEVSKGTNTNPKSDTPVEPTPEPSEEPDVPEEPDIPEEDQGKVVVKDSALTWETNSEINIFNTSLVNNKIAPESGSTYQFTINNNTEYDVKYKIIFIEANNYNINMKYKLRKNNSYVVSEYSSLSALNLTDQLLDANKNDAFYLEWKWVSSDNDTEIGANLDSNYSLKIVVEAEAINE